MATSISWGLVGTKACVLVCTNLDRPGVLIAHYVYTIVDRCIYRSGPYVFQETL